LKSFIAEVNLPHKQEEGDAVMGTKMWIILSGLPITTLVLAFASGTGDIDICQAGTIKTNPALVSSFNLNVDRLRADSASLKNLAAQTRTMDLGRYINVQKMAFRKAQGLINHVKALNNGVARLRGYGDVVQIQRWQTRIASAKNDIQLFLKSASDPPTEALSPPDPVYVSRDSIQLTTPQILSIRLNEIAHIATICASQADCLSIWRINCTDCCQIDDSPFSDDFIRQEEQYCYAQCSARRNTLAIECVYQSATGLLDQVNDMRMSAIQNMTP
jgi:hypothetical protein